MKVRLRGINQIRQIAEDIKDSTGDRRIIKSVARDLRQGAVPPIRQAVRDNAVATLPHRGGLNLWVARAAVRATVRTSGNRAGITIKAARKGHDIKSIDAGRVRHPVWNSGAWAEQSVKPGFFSDPAREEGIKMVEQAIDNAIAEAVRKIYGF